MKFSVVIPTRNRAALLEHALTSALAQSFDSYEVVVSNNDCSDGTDAVVEAHKDSRLKYVRTDRAISMVDHWNFALGHTSGQWVLVLCDDDALMPDCLACLDRLTAEHPTIDVFRYAEATYYYDDGVAATGNYLKYRRPRPDTVEVVRSDRRLKTAFRTMGTDLPKLLNCAVRMDLLERIRERHGRICLNWDPDYSAGVLLLANTQHYVTVHNPLLLWGKNLLSYGAGAQLDPKLSMQFFLEFEEFDGTFPYSPYPTFVTLLTNSQYDTLHRAKDHLGDPKYGLETDPYIFRRLVLNDIEVYIQRGHEEYRAQRDTVSADLRRMSPLARTEHLQTKLTTFLGRGYATITGRRARSRRIRGTDGGFRNIAEAADFFARHLRLRNQR